MADAQNSPSAVPEPLASPDDLMTAWNHFRSGEQVACPVDQGPLALAVDASAGMYRFVCAQCGAASAWFASGATGIHVHEALPEPHGR